MDIYKFNYFKINIIFWFSIDIILLDIYRGKYLFNCFD